MRILTTSMCYPTATHPDQGIFVQRRSLALQQLPGVSLRVVSPQPWCPLFRSTPTGDLTGPLPACYPRMLSVPVLGWAIDGLSYARVLEREITSDIHHGRRPDVIDAHFEYPDGVGAWLAGNRCGIPVVVTVRGKIVSLSRKAIRRMQIARMLRGVTARIAVSQSLAEWTRRIGGSDLSVQVIPNGVDHAVFHPVPMEHARQKLQWDATARYVLAVGHQQYVKGFDRLLAAVRTVRESKPDVHFVFAGSTRGEKQFQSQLYRQLKECNAGAPSDSPVAQFVGAVSPHTLNQMYNAADLMVNVSRSEGWCNAINEALACGVPVLATDVGGNREQVNNPALGRIVSSPAPEPLAAAILEMLEADWNRAAISDLGSRRTWSQTALEAWAVLSAAARANRPSDSFEFTGAYI